MDRRRALLGAIAIGACAGEPASAPAPPLAEPGEFIEISWLAAEADPLSVLTEQPASCLRRADNDEAARRVRMGEIAFSSSALLGGQAARAGLSCESCHRNGRGHPDFFLPGVADTPGTADVTNGFLGPGRADGAHNPVPIPDLGAAGDRVFLATADHDDIEAFVHAQLVEEFDAPAPGPVVLDALAAYLEAIDPIACGPGPQAITWEDDFNAASDAARFAADGEAEADFMLRAAREGLGRLHERFWREDIRLQLIELSAMLNAARTNAELRGDAADAIAALRDDLAAAAPNSFYDRDVLARAFAD